MTDRRAGCDMAATPHAQSSADQALGRFRNVASSVVQDDSG
jgi:hypothetical protein